MLIIFFWWLHNPRWLPQKSQCSYFKWQWHSQFLFFKGQYIIPLVKDITKSVYGFWKKIKIPPLEARTPSRRELKLYNFSLWIFPFIAEFAMESKEASIKETYHYTDKLRKKKQHDRNYLSQAHFKQDFALPLKVDVVIPVLKHWGQLLLKSN